MILYTLTWQDQDRIAYPRHWTVRWWHTVYDHPMITGSFVDLHKHAYLHKHTQSQNNQTQKSHNFKQISIVSNNNDFLLWQSFPYHNFFVMMYNANEKEFWRIFYCRFPVTDAEMHSLPLTRRGSGCSVSSESSVTFTPLSLHMEPPRNICIH